jgi:hypothetical protein
MVHGPPLSQTNYMRQTDNNNTSSKQHQAGQMDLYEKCSDIARNPWHTRWICPLLLLADAGLTALIIWKVPCE